MSTFAKISTDGLVEDIAVVPEDHTVDGGEFLATTLGLGGRWVEASLETRDGIHYSPATGVPSARQDLALRGNYPTIGVSLYSEELDLFILPSPDSTWVFNTQNACWDPPVERPVGGQYYWSTETESWVEVFSPYPSWVLTAFGSIQMWVPPTHPENELTGEPDSLFWDEDSLSWVAKAASLAAARQELIDLGLSESAADAIMASR